MLNKHLGLFSFSSFQTSLIGISGILLVLFGVYTINMESLVFSELLRPFRAMARDRATQFALLTLISVAYYSLVDKIAVDHMNPVIFAYVYPWVSRSLFSGYIFKVKTKGVLKKEWKNHKGSILVCGFLSIFGYFLILLAFTFERMSYLYQILEEIVTFIIDQNKGRKSNHLDFPDRFHTEFGEVNAFNFFDVFFRQ